MAWPKPVMPLAQLRLALILLIVISVTLDILFYVMPRVTNSSRLEDVLLAKFKPIPGRSLFFIETRSRAAPLPGGSLIFKLTDRQACAIESAALHNPNTNIFVMFVSPIHHRNKLTTDPVLESVCSYSNVHLRTLNLWTFATNTPVFGWVEEGKLYTSRYVTEHTADFLRYLTLWRWGGTYLDMDVIVLRSMEELPPNYMAAQSNQSLNNAILNFAHNGIGHYVASGCLHNFQRNFDGEDWSKNGPGVLNRVMQFLCGTDKIELMMNSDHCRGFNVFASKAFYAIPYEHWDFFVEPQYLEHTLSLLNESYVAHLWNKLSKQKRIQVGSNTAYGKLAEKHCPKVYAAAGEVF